MRRAQTPKPPRQFTDEEAQRLRIMWTAHIEREQNRDIVVWFAKAIGITLGVVGVVLAVSFTVYAAFNGGTVDLW